MSHIVDRVRRLGRRPHGTGEFEGRVKSELNDCLPEEDLGEELGDWLEMYRLGSKPRCEEAEYIDLMQDAVDRIARGY